MVVVVVGGWWCGMGRGVVGTERERTNIHIYGLWGGVLFFFFFFLLLLLSVARGRFLFLLLWKKNRFVIFL